MNHDLEMSLEGLVNDLENCAVDIAICDIDLDNGVAGVSIADWTRLVSRQDTARQNFLIFVTDLLPTY